MRKNFWRCLAAAIVAYGTGCWSAEAKLFDVTEFYLDNGMQVIVIPNSKAPIVKQMVWYKAGSVDEPLGKGGLAHLLEHLMFRGTEKVPGSVFNDIVTNNGGVMNAFTSQDFTAYHEFVGESRISQAVCQKGKYTGCDDVLQSPASQIGGIPMSDIGLVYFLGSILALLLSVFVPLQPVTLSLLWIMAVCSIPYGLFSVCYQNSCQLCRPDHSARAPSLYILECQREFHNK